jgi:hypothetical protein
MLAVSGFSHLAWAALAWVVLAIALSQWAAARRPKPASTEMKAPA